MINIDKDYLITVDLKNTKVKSDKTIFFYNTDLNICNIFIKLICSDEDKTIPEDLIVEFAVLKPETDEFKPLDATLISKEDLLYQVDLTTDYFDIVGKYSCEIRVSGTIENELKCFTSEEFDYVVKPNITAKLNKKIKNDKNLPILEKLIKDVKEITDGINKNEIQMKRDENLVGDNKTVVGAINQLREDVNSGIGGGTAELKDYQKKNDEFLNTDEKTITGGINEVNNKIKKVQESQIELDKDDVSFNGIDDISHDELNTTDKTVIGAINEVNAQYKDIANYSLTKGTDGKVYIKKQDGTLLGEGIEVGSDADLSKITMRMNGQTLKLMNGEEQIASVDLPVGTGEIPDNTVLYEEDSESMGDVITAENITIKDTNNNFTSTHVEGALNELFQSASNGKTLIANAITGKGVKTNATDSFQTMATNIENISGGSGGITPTGTKEITQNGTYDVTNFATVLVNITSSGGNIESGTITPTKQSTTLDIPTTKKCSNLVFFQHEMKGGAGYRTLAGLLRCGGVGINLASNSTGATLNLISTSGTPLDCVVVTFNDNSIHISSNANAGGGGYLVDKQYDWYAW